MRFSATTVLSAAAVLSGTVYADAESIVSDASSSVASVASDAASVASSATTAPELPTFTVSALPISRSHHIMIGGDTRANIDSPAIQNQG